MNYFSLLFRQARRWRARVGCLPESRSSASLNSRSVVGRNIVPSCGRATRMSGSMPRCQKECLLGVSHSSTAKAGPNRRTTGIRSGRCRCQRSFADRHGPAASCNAPATISESLAEPPLIRTAMGRFGLRPAGLDRHRGEFPAASFSQKTLPEARNWLVVPMSAGP